MTKLCDILVVENHPDTLKYIGRYLRRNGYEVREAVDLETALLQARSKPPKILLSDIGLPDGDGWELLDSLKSEGIYPYSISMSGFGYGSDQDKSLLAGYNHHLIKPFQFVELQDLLDQVDS